jgi:hypothetical protein
VINPERYCAPQQSDSIVIRYFVAELHGAVSDPGHCVLSEAAEAASGRSLGHGCSPSVRPGSVHFPEREVDSAIDQERFDGSQRREHLVVDRLAFGAAGQLLHRCDGYGPDLVDDLSG